MNDGTVSTKDVVKVLEPSLSRKQINPLSFNLNLALFSFPSSSHPPLVA